MRLISQAFIKVGVGSTNIIVRQQKGFYGRCFMFLLPVRTCVGVCKNTAHVCVRGVQQKSLMIVDGYAPDRLIERR